MDLQSLHPVSTIRRNPPRKAKRAVSKNDQISFKPSNAITGIPPFTPDEIIEPEPPQISEVGISNSLKVFLRICPIDCRATQGQNIAGGEARAKGRGRLAKEVDVKTMPCLFVNSSSSVTLTAPPSAQGSNRSKNEVYDGFSHVFSSESSQEDIYNKIMQPLVMDFIGGHSSLLVAMGPTGSGKTYTMFGSPQQLGIVHLALRQIFSHKAENENIQVSRVYFLSMFEIHSERGKGEKFFDLFPDIISHQQASISSFKEVKITTVDDAAKIVAHGISKRSTALTNANNQSSRSQCIINVRCVQKSDADNHSLSNAVLTIADLAGAERERKTGNQGSRLMESNFINNTSMVFGQCLRSLLEHQKNLKKPIEKHFKNSLLTRYLQDYMEGRKRMTLILTVKAAQEDYMDTSFVLRQASPYMKIKFNHLHLYNNAPCQKRKDQLAKIERSKRQKVSISEVSLIDGNLTLTDAAIKTTLSEKDSFEEGFGKQVDTALHDALLLKIKGEENMRNFARALLSTLEQYKLKLTESENEVQHLKESLKKQSAHFTDMEKKLAELSRNPRSCSCNSFVEECIPYHKHGTFVLPNVNGTALSPETSGKNETNHDAQMVDVSLFDTINEVYRCELPLPVNQTTLQQAEIPAEGYSSLTMEGNSMDSSYQHPGGNSKSLQKNAQSDNEVGDMGCSLHILGNEEISMMQAEKSPETSGKNETDPDANMVDASLLDTITEVDRCALPLPVNRMALQQAEIPAEDYSSLPLKENFIELSCQRSGGNSKSLQKDAQSDVEVGDKGCCLHILGNEEILIMQAEKKIMAENVTLTDNAQQTAPSHSTEALKCKEDDPALKPLNSQRPRRKLLPASAILMKEFDGLFMDENATEEVKRKRTANTEGRSDGNVSLIQIFKSNLQR